MRDLARTNGAGGRCIVVGADLIVSEDAQHPGKTVVAAGTWERFIYIVTHPTEDVGAAFCASQGLCLARADQDFLFEFLATYPYVAPTKAEAGKLLVESLRKRWLNEPVGVAEDAVDCAYLGLKNGKNQEQCA